MKSETRRKLADIVAAILTIGLVVAALWLARCSSEPVAAYYAPDTTAITPDTIADSIAGQHRKKKEKETKKRHKPRSRDFLNEPVAAP